MIWSYDGHFMIAIEYLIKIFEVILDSVKRHPTMPHLLLIAHRLEKLVLSIDQQSLKNLLVISIN